MARIYQTPDEEVPPPIPDYSDYDYERESMIERKYMKDLQKYLRTKRKGDMVGSVMKHPVADGYALYMVASQKPFELVHLDLGDGYRADAAWERGVRLSDVRDRIEFEKKLEQLTL